MMFFKGFMFIIQGARLILQNTSLGILVSAISFDSQEKAIKFEQYLKSGSGRAFIKKRFL